MQIQNIFITAAIIFLLSACGRNNPSHLLADEAKSLEIFYCTEQEVCEEAKVDSGKVWCVQVSECPANDSCYCSLYRDKRGGGRDWEEYGRRGEKKAYDASYVYACWCGESL